VWEIPIEKKHEDQSTVNLLVLSEKIVLRNNILRWLLLRRERVQSRKEDNSK